jgi:hypothetical protein
VLIALRSPALARVAAIVHDLDLKDHEFAPPEAPAIGTIIDGLQLTHEDDHELLAGGMSLFEALCRAFEQAARPAGPRVVAEKRGVSSPSNGGTRRRPAK